MEATAIESGLGAGSSTNLNDLVMTAIEIEGISRGS